MSFFYKSTRVGKNGKLFNVYKFKTLKNDVDKTSSFAKPEQYTTYGRFMRKTKIDEFPQIWNVIKRDLNLVGVRAEEEKTIKLIPDDIKDIILSRRPGLTSLASIHFFEESQALENSDDPQRDYWLKIRPLKITLDIFYIQNRDIFLDFWIVWKTTVMIVRSFFK